MVLRIPFGPPLDLKGHPHRCQTAVLVCETFLPVCLRWHNLRR